MSAVTTFYNSVINEVIESLKTQFNEEGIDPAVLNDLKEIWEKKIKDSGALDPLKHGMVQSAGHFSSIMQQQHQHPNMGINDGSGQRGNVAARITSIGNPTSRLIKPSGQGSTMQDQSGFNAGRMTVPLIVQGSGATFRPVNSLVNNFSNQPNSHLRDMYPVAYRMPTFHQNYDYLFEQWLKTDRLRNADKTKQQQQAMGSRNDAVPMVINASQQPGMALFSQYHNILSTQNHGQQQQIISDNGVVNLRKNQVDGVDDESSEDEESDFVNVSEVDPQSVRPPMSNVPPTPAIFKKETKEQETDEELIEEEIDNMNHANISVKNEESDEDENDEDDEAEEAQNEEEPLNSEDDISDDDPEKIFETDNVIVCQYEKVNRTRNKWKLNFVSGIANLHGKDSVFHKAVGEAEW